MFNLLGYGDVRFCTSRKEAKAHGEGGLFIGAPITPGARVLIIDDVITDGGTKREAVDLIRQHGGVPVGLCIAFDRRERGGGSFSASQEFEREYRIPVHAVATCNDLIWSLEKKSVEVGGKKSKDILAKVQAYNHQYGC
jgi:orotate phosphoribosyltransferase